MAKNDEKTKEEQKVNVSDLFVDIYKNFNVTTQVEKMKQLSEKELYLLIILCLDKHSDEDPVVIHNLKEFEKEVMLVFDLQDDKEIENESLKELVKETNDTYINTEVVLDMEGNKLPEPLDKQEVRDAKINIISVDEVVYTYSIFLL